MNRIQEAFEISKALFRAFPISKRGSKCGPNVWRQQQHHFKARDALRSATQGERKIYVNLLQMAKWCDLQAIPAYP